MALGERLTAARTRSGLGQDDLAAALGVSRAMVSYWETAKRRPNDRQLTILSQLLRTSIATLEGHEPEPAAPDLAGMILRTLADPPDEARQGLQDFVSFLDGYSDLAAAADYTLHGMKQSPFVSASGYEGADDARRKAEEVRSHLRLGLGPIGDMDSVCELLGVTVYRADLGLDLSKTVSGAFLNHPEVGFSILINLSMTPGRRRFTQAHELAHALFHGDDRYLVSTSAKNPRERFADNFAGEFLMPSEGVRRVMEEHGFGPKIQEPAEVIQLQRFYDVSYITALVRLRHMRALTAQAFDEFKNIRPVLFARALGYEINDEEIHQEPAKWHLDRFPPRFRHLIRRAVSTGVISVPTAAALTGLPIDELADLVAPSTRAVQATSEQRAELKQYEESGVIEYA